MHSADGVLLSVSTEARQLTAPDYAVLDGLIEHTAGSKEEAVRSVSASLDRLTADLAALGAVPFAQDAGNLPLTWSAHGARWDVDWDNPAWKQVRPAGGRAARAFSRGGEQPAVPALTPVPQELTATIGARFRTTAVGLPGT
jgi:hypothetical protein